MSGREARLTLFRGDRLDYRFCTPSWRATRRPLPADEVMAQARAVDGARCQRLTFGDAASSHPDFDAIVRQCRALGLGHFALETDGKDLAREGAADALAEAGFEKVFVVVGGIRKRVWETVLHDEGFLEAMEGLRNAAASRLELYAIAPVVKWSEKDLEPLLDWLTLLEGGLRGFLLSLPEVARVPRAGWPLLLSGSAQAEIAARIFDACARKRIEHGFSTRRGIVACAAGRALDRFGTVHLDRVNYLAHERGEGEAFRKPEACGACSLASRCPGVEASYLEAFGDAEIRPVALEVSMGWRLKRLNTLEQREYKNVSAFDGAAAGAGRSLVRLNGRCNMQCSFCFVDRTAPDFAVAELARDVEALAARNTDHIVLSGGEPTLHPELTVLVALAKRLGFRTIEIQTNGVAAADASFAAALAAAGLNKVTVSLHSSDAEQSDTITRLPGAFDKSVRALHNFRRLGIETQIAHVVTKWNYERLGETVRFLRRELPREGGRLSICFGVAQPISDLVYTWLMPTFDEIRPHMREALDYCLDNDIGFGGMIGQGGYPPCMLGGDMRYYASALGHIYRSAGEDRDFCKSARCAECSFDPWCVGVRRIYVETYGDLEMRPFSAPIEEMMQRARGEGAGR